MLEEEEVILELEELGAAMPRVDLSASLRGAPNNLGALVPRASAQMTVGDWSQCRITWGKKHRGQTYAQVLRTDPGYVQWALARFNSLTPQIQDFVKYCQVQMDLDQNA